jgi:hemerythrin-like domain-containing protein
MVVALVSQDVHDEDALSRLLRTHARMEENLVDLERAAAEMRMETIDDVVAFFGRAGARHHDDEERCFFPKLRGVAALAPIVAELESEHRAHDALYAELRDAARAPGDGEGLRATVAKFATAYRAHIRKEEDELFPRVRALLDANALAEIARDLDARRGGGGRGRS